MTDRRATLDGRALSLMLLCCALWGVNQVVAKLTLVGIPPLLQAGLRSLGAALLVMGWARSRGISLHWRNGTLAGGLLAGAMFAVEFACIFVGLQYTSASRMVVFIYLAPFVVALGMPWVTGTERLTTRQWLGLAAAFGGVAWAFAEGFQRPVLGDRQWLGDALGVAGAVLWGGTTLVVRGTRLATAAPEQTLWYQLAVSGVLLTLASGVSEVWPTRWTTGPLAGLVFQTVVVAAFSYLAWFWLVRHYPATTLSSFTLLTPMFGLAAGVLLLGEPLTLRLLVAGLAVAGGIALVNSRRQT